MDISKIFKIASFLEAISGFYKAAQEWSDFIRWEYWIFNGESLFADIDAGETGHEAIAVNYLLDKDALLDGLIERANEDGDEEEVDKLEEYRNDDNVDASGIYFEEQISDTILANAISVDNAPKEEVLRDFRKDPRYAFVKYMGAIQVVGTDFYLWSINKSNIDYIIDFLYERLGESGFVKNKDKRIYIEEGKTGNTYSPTLSDLMETGVRGFLTPKQEDDELPE